MGNVVILHGWASVTENWQPLTNVLKKAGYKVLMPELPGFKQELQRPWNTADYANWLSDFIKIQKIKNPILIGHSFGGQIATEFIASHQQNVAKLVLINSAGIRKGITMKKIIFYLPTKIGKLIFTIPPLSFLKNSVRKLIYKSAREQDYYQASPMMRRTMKLIIRDDQVNNLKKITTPTLILWGAKDTITPMRDGYTIKSHLKNSQLITYQQARHSPQFTHASEVAVDIIQFLKS